MGQQQKVLITGASRGIGREIALILHGLGYSVIGTYYPLDKTDDRVENIEYLPLDFNDEDSIFALAQKVKDVDILINNVGQSQIGPVEETPVDKIRKDFQVNFFGMISLTQAFLPGMRERKSGTIINIGSMAGKFAIPFQSIYVATKAAVAGFSWALRNEVMNFGIKVVVIEPNDIKTTIEPAVFLKDDSVYRDSVLKMKGVRDKNMAHAPGPEIVGKKVAKILKKNKPRPFYTVGGIGPLLVFLKRFLPDKVIEKFLKRNYGLK
ncbi:MAG: SDR family oxidoreductase [Candidatus Aminicenantes bacterium]|nr:SDR family oxidoreductase [Candidatus Aminicenantes bacterium]